MKQHFILVLISLAALTFIACDDDNDPKNSKNYWNQNALVHMQLKGKVKSVKETDSWGSTSEIFFNTDGNITLEVFGAQGAEDSTVYKYEGGKLISVGNEIYEYDSHGKYIPRAAFHINMVGLTPNLKSITYDDRNSKTDYTFDGNKLLIIYAYAISKDTFSINYTGKYPTSFRSIDENKWGEYMVATYASNGMFLTYEEGFYSEGSQPYTDSRKTFYKADKEYLLIDKKVNNYVSSSSTWSTTTTYTYNDKKDLIRELSINEEGITVQSTAYSYEYDSKGNWTKITSVETYGENQQHETMRERVISYY